MTACARTGPLPRLPLSGTLGRIAAEIASAALAAGTVVRLGEHVAAPFLVMAVGGLVMTVVLARVILAALLLLVSPRSWAAFDHAARRADGGVGRRFGRRRR